MLLRRLRAVLLALGIAALVGACGDDADDGYTAEIRAAFMQGCVEDSDDPDLEAVCACTYDTAEEELPFERFRAAENDLMRGATDVPSDISDLVIECIRSVSADR